MEDLGPRLRHIRELHGLSQRALARASGVSNATVSLIEHNRTNPSLGMLKKILDSVPISIADFFALELEGQGKVVHRADELVEIGTGQVSYRQVGTDLGDRHLQIIVERYPPGADTGRSMLTHEAEEGGVVLSGRLELTVGEQTHLLGPGDAYLFNSRIPHRFRNAGSQDCVMISACTPPSF